MHLNSASYTPTIGVFVALLECTLCRRNATNTPFLGLKMVYNWHWRGVNLFKEEKKENIIIYKGFWCY